ncbi:MAG: M15 family metallopeptidase [Candidatus Magasanikbacteria bacterium]
MNKKRIIDYQEMLNTPIEENGEDLMCIQEQTDEIICEYEKEDMIPYTGDKMYARATVVKKLIKANNLLKQKDNNQKLRVVYAYRHPEIQEKYFKNKKQELREENPNLRGKELNALVHNFVAVPKVAGHPTGGAVDLTITSPKGDLDMGTGIADYSDKDKIKTFSDKVTEKQKENRNLLREVMLEAGFAPFNGEWWHFSYGDREWAVYYDKNHAIYDQILIKK